MRLGQILYRYRCTIPYRYRGKYRIVKKPSMEHLNRMRDDLDREERNMLLLRHPYLTIEQEHGSTKPLRDTVEIIEMLKEKQREKFRKQITFADRLAHLRVTEAWD
ncbi:hypothetical protein DMN91_011512 [Ooceraea biroi]|uniref:Ribosomal protein 63, mitochondrial n=1 Tax=Ooceraea biroi TaxID=2015173 RepID=A0A026WAM4_OOCBI|nr:ribosomal protein 63, mitochondrial [Ooceraea biroi]XP_011342301.1 ribosomal protein 63, mitochondrial [Ooceraea biroi]EZA52079.1 hypothetical protein X777_09087 [Ooceraea biroi]RLU15756.1 hypothetical protein DMN91_011512 [Ooceraea biroi]